MISRLATISCILILSLFLFGFSKRADDGLKKDDDPKKGNGNVKQEPGNEWCITCHGEFMHMKDKRSRALNNMHISFMVCEVAI